jgi:hypothetical protein
MSLDYSLDLANLNWLAVIAAAAWGILLGLVWHARSIFGHSLLKPEPTQGVPRKRASGQAIATLAAGAIVAAIVLAMLIQAASLANSVAAAGFPCDPSFGDSGCAVSGAVDGAVVGALAAFLPASAVALVAVLEKRTPSWLASQVGYIFIGAVGMGAILGLWQGNAPAF